MMSEVLWYAVVFAKYIKLAESSEALSLPKRPYLTLLQNNLAKRLPGLEKESF